MSPTVFARATDAALRVATKYVNTTRRFFARTWRHRDYRIVESSGATEGAPAAGSADLIVDITTTGATLAANALKVHRGRRHPALAGQSRRIADGAVERNGARSGARHSLAHRRGRRSAHDARGARDVCRLTNRSCARPGELRRRRCATADGDSATFSCPAKTGRGARRLADRTWREERHERTARLRLPRRQCVVEQTCGAALGNSNVIPDAREARDRESRAKPKTRICSRFPVGPSVRRE